MIYDSIRKAPPLARSPPQISRHRPTSSVEISVNDCRYCLVLLLHAAHSSTTLAYTSFSNFDNSPSAFSKESARYNQNTRRRNASRRICDRSRHQNRYSPRRYGTPRLVLAYLRSILPRSSTTWSAKVLVRLGGATPRAAKDARHASEGISAATRPSLNVGTAPSIRSDAITWRLRSPSPRATPAPSSPASCSHRAPRLALNDGNRPEASPTLIFRCSQHRRHKNIRRTTSA